MNYQTLTTQLTVVPNGEPIYAEGVTHVSVDDENAGPFLVLTQHPDAGEQTLRFDFEEWDHIDAAVRRLIAEYSGCEGDKETVICESEYKDMLAAKPETFEAHGKTWFKHDGSENCPCHPDAKVNCYSSATHYRDTDKSVIAGEVSWMYVLGWRYANEKPNTFEVHGKTWFKHDGSENCPCDPEREISWVLRSDFGYGKHVPGPMKAKELPWDEEIAGWRYADEERQWRLPDPPEGQQWHRTDWIEDMLPEGYRPLLDGEKVQPGDCFLWFGEWKPVGQIAFNVLDQGSLHHRTTRPLPTT